MKHFILAAAFMASTAFAYAQTATDYDEKPSSRRIKKLEQVTNIFEGAEMNVTRELASFANLPDVPKPTWAVITNVDGEFIKESKITPSYNAMDIHRLPKGMYFVTLVYRNKNQKAFVLNVTE